MNASWSGRRGPQHPLGQLWQAPDRVRVERHVHVGREHGDQQRDQPPARERVQAGEQRSDAPGHLGRAAERHQLAVRGQVRGHDRLVARGPQEVQRARHGERHAERTGRRAAGQNGRCDQGHGRGMLDQGYAFLRLPRPSDHRRQQRHRRRHRSRRDRGRLARRAGRALAGQDRRPGRRARRRQRAGRALRRDRMGRPAGRRGRRAGGVRTPGRLLRQRRLRGLARVPGGESRALARDGRHQRLRRRAVDPRLPGPLQRAGRRPLPGHGLGSREG